MAKTDLHKKLIEEGFRCSKLYSLREIDTEEKADELVKDIIEMFGQYHNDLIKDCLIVTTDALFEGRARKNPYRVYLCVRKFKR